MAEFRMPSLGADMESGTLVEWVKKPGDAIRRGDVIAVVETQKGAIEVEIFSDGVMAAQLVPVGTTVPVGTPLALIDGMAAETPSAGTPSAPPAIAAPPSGAAAPPGKAPPSAGGVGAPGFRASPAARNRAAERGLDITQIRGSGPDGAITLSDVDAAAAPAAAPHAGLDLDKMRQAIAAAMAHSKREIPHYYLATEIDLGRTLTWLEHENASRQPEARLLPTVLILKAVALALTKYPRLNGFYENGSYRPSAAVHIGTAINIRGGGLVTPAIHDCSSKSLDELMTALRDLVARARVGRLRSSEITDATITVSSLGERGVEQLFGIIFPPQVAIVGCGRIHSKPVAVDDAISVRPVITTTLAGDHRVTDGHLGALFLNEFARLLQEPQSL